MCDKTRHYCAKRFGWTAVLFKSVLFAQNVTSNNWRALIWALLGAWSSNKHQYVLLELLKLNSLGFWRLLCFKINMLCISPQWTSVTLEVLYGKGSLHHRERHTLQLSAHWKGIDPLSVLRAQSIARQNKVCPAHTRHTGRKVSEIQLLGDAVTLIPG